MNRRLVEKKMTLKQNLLYQNLFLFGIGSLNILFFNGMILELLQKEWFALLYQESDLSFEQEWPDSVVCNLLKLSNFKLGDSLIHIN